MNNTISLSNLPKITTRGKKRLGRGHGSGKVKTSGRGTKGQKSRGSIKPGFEGGQLSLIKRLPLLRGKGKNKSVRDGSMAVSLEKLNRLPEGTEVTVETLRKHGIIDKDVTRVKILGNGKIEVALTIRVPCSKGAKGLIEKAGGTLADPS
jgi:large subunit ribosomal protein L15